MARCVRRVRPGQLAGGGDLELVGAAQPGDLLVGELIGPAVER
jgi:hypothetical protein